MSTCAKSKFCALSNELYRALLFAAQVYQNKNITLLSVNNLYIVTLRHLLQKMIGCWKAPVLLKWAIKKNLNAFRETTCRFL